MSAPDSRSGRSSHGITINLPHPAPSSPPPAPAELPRVSSLSHVTDQVFPFSPSFPPRISTLTRSLFLHKPSPGGLLLDDDDLYPEHGLPPSRSASASSSLDPYYFREPSPDSFLPSLPPLPQTATTPDQPPINEPVTPAKNPASIDRRGLVGVGELATPRWTKSERSAGIDDGGNTSPFSAVEVVVSEHSPDDKRGSPWTIEAVEEDVSSLPFHLPRLISFSSSLWSLLRSR